MDTTARLAAFWRGLKTDPLSEEGEKYRFEYRHFRPHILALPDRKGYKCERYMRGVTQWKPSERGGATLCFVFNDSNGAHAWGLAFCCMRDNFSYRLGREIAKGRALAALRGAEPKHFNGQKLSGIGGAYTLSKVAVLSIPA